MQCLRDKIVAYAQDDHNRRALIVEVQRNSQKKSATNFMAHMRRRGEAGGNDMWKSVIF